MKVQKLPIDTVKPYWRNPRKNDAAVEAVRKSIEEFGFNSPIIVDQEQTIIVGHTRYRALRELGWNEAPCVIVDLDAQKAKAYRVADNKTGEIAEWDMDKLIPELRELENIEQMDIFFPDIDLNELLAESVGAMDFSNVTTDQVNAAATERESAFEGADAAQKDAQLEIICPHCSEEFYVTRKDILER